MVPPEFVTRRSLCRDLKPCSTNLAKISWCNRKKKKAKQTSVQMARELFASAKEYTQNTTLHGLRYIGADGLHVVERFFWIAAFAAGMLAAAYFTATLYIRWHDNPMMISLRPGAIPLSSIPFPSITICNMNGAVKLTAQRILNNKNNDSDAIFERHMLREVCKERHEQMGSPLEMFDFEWDKIEHFLIKVSQPCHEMVVSCIWRNKKLPCRDLFNSEVTDDGMCCSFNQVEKKFIYKNLKQLHGSNVTYPNPRIEWTPEEGYPPDSPPTVYPWKALGTGSSMGLTLVLDAALHDYYCSSTASGGFKLLLHNPIETPKMSEFSYYLSPGFETRVEILPQVHSSTTNVYEIPQLKRQCHFTKDRQLRFFKTYTQSNCELECKSNLTLVHCNCTPYNLPKDDTTRICGTKDIDCMVGVEGVFNHLTEFNASKRDIDHIESCSCFPGCVHVSYRKQMSASKLQAKFNLNSNFQEGINLTYFKQNMAVVHFFFLESNFIPFEKGEIFGFTDFLSNVGGLLGLFLGFSFMSAAEILYFMSLRVICAWRRKTRRKVSTQYPFTH